MPLNNTVIRCTIAAASRPDARNGCARAGGHGPRHARLKAAISPRRARRLSHVETPSVAASGPPDADVAPVGRSHAQRVAQIRRVRRSDGTSSRARNRARSGCLEDGAKPSFPTSQDQCSGRAGSPTTRSSPRRAPSPVRRGPRPSVATPPQRSAAAARCTRHSSAACSSRAISHAPKRRVSRSIMGAGPPGVAASGDRSRPSRMSGTGSAVSPSARHLAWRCW